MRRWIFHRTIRCNSNRDAAMRTHSNNEFRENPADEPIGESLLKPCGWLAAVAFVALSATVQMADSRDNSAEWAQSTELKGRQDAQMRHEHAQRSAQAMCSSDFGPQVLAVWVDDTTVECVNPRGRRLSSIPADEVAGAAH